MKILPIFLLITTLFIGYNNLQASQARQQSSSSVTSNSFGGWVDATPERPGTYWSSASLRFAHELAHSCENSYNSTIVFESITSIMEEFTKGFLQNSTLTSDQLRKRMIALPYIQKHLSIIETDIKNKFIEEQKVLLPSNVSAKILAERAEDYASREIQVLVFKLAKHIRTECLQQMATQTEQRTTMRDSMQQLNQLMQSLPDKIIALHINTRVTAEAIAAILANQTIAADLQECQRLAQLCEAKFPETEVLVEQLYHESLKRTYAETEEDKRRQAQIMAIASASSSQSRQQSASSAATDSGSTWGWIKSWFVSAPTEQQKKIAALVGASAPKKHKELADILYESTQLPEDIIKLIVAYDAKIFSQHSGPITALVALSHGRLASASDDKTIKIWDIEGDRCLQTLTGHTAEVTALAVLEDDRLASGANDNTIRIWENNLEKCKILTLDKPAAIWRSNWRSWQYNRITALAALPNNKLASGIYTSYKRGGIVIWDLISGNWIFSIPCPCNTLFALSNSNLIAAIPTPSDLVFIDQSSDQTPETIDRAHRFEITALAALPNNQFASASRDHHIKTWDLQTRQEIKRYSPYNFFQRINEGLPIFLAALPNNTLASGWGDGKIRILDLDTMQCIRTLEGHTDAVTAVAALPNGQLASGSDDGTVRIWNLEQEEHKE